MNASFRKAVERMPALFDHLLARQPIALGSKAEFPDEPGVYLIYEKRKPLYTGRCRSLRKRIGNHVGRSPGNSAFAFRLACETVEYETSYKKGSARQRLMKDEQFRAIFQGNVERIRQMSARYVVIDDDVLQHLFEVYVHLAAKTPHNTFATH